MGQEPLNAADYADDDAKIAATIAKAMGSVPALRPRMFGVIDESGILRRVNLAHVVQWWRVPERSATGEVAIMVIQLDGGGLMYRIPDPHGEVDKALCSAFFDCTLDSLI